MVEKERAIELAHKIKNVISVQNAIYLADKVNPPSLDFYEDELQFYDSHNNLIHMGIFGPTEYFKVETDEDYLAGVQYFFGHENEHVISTASEPYDNGIKRSVKEIIKYIATAEGFTKNFKNDRDYESFLSTDLRSKGIMIIMPQLMQICGNIMNAVEDGRIERIRANRLPGFESERRYFRAIVWNQDNEYVPYNELDDSSKLSLFINCTLSLATTQLYPKNFLREYGEHKDIMNVVYSLMPHVGRAILARRTRVMAEHVIEVIKILAPYIYNAVKMDANALENLINQFKENILNQLMEMIDGCKNGTSEREEKEDDGIPNSCFGNSNLVVTLPDEEYDKLMENMEKQGKESTSGSGVMIQREHPKEDEETPGKNGEETSKSSDSSEKKGEEKSQNNGDSSNEEGTNDGSKNEVGNKNTENKEPGKSQTQDGQNDSSDSKSDGQTSKLSSKHDASKNNKLNSFKESNETSSGTKEEQNSTTKGSGSGDGNLETVMKEAKEAAQKTRLEVGDLLTSINESIAHSTTSTKNNLKPVIDTQKPLTAEDVKDITERGFEEIKREYRLSSDLPPVLNARAKAFRRKNERYFKSLSTPNVSNLNSGNVDPSLIYGLSFGETDIFRKNGVDRHFDGCAYVLLDNSGSMSGNKRTEAGKAAAVIEEGFKGLFPFKMVAFDTCGPVIHEVIKGWDEVQRKNCSWNFVQHGRSGCGNDDSIDIAIATKELLARPEEKKMLIILSDGAPSSVEETKDAVAKARKSGIQVYGIYFEDGCIGDDADTFKHMYEKDYVCCELSNVDTELTKLMVKFSRS